MTSHTVHENIASSKKGRRGEDGCFASVQARQEKRERQDGEEAYFLWWAGSLSIAK